MLRRMKKFWRWLRIVCRVAHPEDKLIGYITRERKIVEEVLRDYYHENFLHENGSATSRIYNRASGQLLEEKPHKSLVEAQKYILPKLKELNGDGG